MWSVGIPKSQSQPGDCLCCSGRDNTQTQEQGACPAGRLSRGKYPHREPLAWFTSPQDCTSWNPLRINQPRSGSCREVPEWNSLLGVPKSSAAGPPVLAASKFWCCQPPALVFKPGNRSEVLDRLTNCSSLQRQVGLCHMIKDILLAWNVAALLWHSIKKKKKK